MTLAWVLKPKFREGSGPSCLSGDRLRVMNKHWARGWLDCMEPRTHGTDGITPRLMAWKRHPLHISRAASDFVADPYTYTHTHKHTYVKLSVWEGI